MRVEVGFNWLWILYNGRCEVAVLNFLVTSRTALKFRLISIKATSLNPLRQIEMKKKTVLQSMDNGKCKDHPRTGHEGPDV